jgi:hypothetical protein
MSARRHVDDDELVRDLPLGEGNAGRGANRLRADDSAV